MTDRQRFTLDMRITAALLLALAVQAATVFVWAGGAQARLAQLETKAEAVDKAGLGERLARLEAHAAAAQASLERIERRLDGAR